MDCGSDFKFIRYDKLAAPGSSLSIYEKSNYKASRSWISVRRFELKIWLGIITKWRIELGVLNNVKSNIQLTKRYLQIYMYIYYQTSPRSRWMKFSFCVFGHWDEGEVHKDDKREQGQYPAILTKLAWSIKDLSLWHSRPLCHFVFFLCVCWFLLQNVLMKLINTFVFFVFILVNTFAFQKIFLLSCTCLEFGIFMLLWATAKNIKFNLRWTNFKLKNIFVVLHLGLAVWNGLSKSGF